MNKFYGGGGVEGHATLRRLESAEPGSHLARHPTPSGSTYRVVPASTYQGPSREGVSGERVPPDSGSTRPYTREEVAFADAYAREQMQDARFPEVAHRVWRN